MKIFARNLGGQFESELGGQFNRCVHPTSQSIRVTNIPPNSMFKIINLQGITIMESNFNLENEIDVSQLSIGVYFIQMYSGNNIRTAKFMKQ